MDRWIYRQMDRYMHIGRHEKRDKEAGKEDKQITKEMNRQRDKTNHQTDKS